MSKSTRKTAKRDICRMRQVKPTFLLGSVCMDMLQHTVANIQNNALLHEDLF